MFDSGVGGLSVWREVVRQLPHESTLYFADQAHEARHRFFTSGSGVGFEGALLRLTGPTGQVTELCWDEGGVLLGVGG